VRRRTIPSLVLVAATGCVYPATEPTGVELSWRFVEHDAPETTPEGDDGEGEEPELRVRSCEGAITEQIAFEITDVDEPRRHAVMRFDCATGFQTAVQLQTSASDAFVRLDPGSYSFAVLAIDDATNAQLAEHVMDRVVDVAKRGVTVEIWQLQRAPVPWTLELHGADGCEELALSLVYIKPEDDLPELAVTDDDAPPLLYRAELRSDRELAVGGQTTPCDAALDGVHRFASVDRGDYLLELDIDGLACAVRVDLRGREGATSVIDLASLPCDG
jgi:hypothetical protein